MELEKRVKGEESSRVKDLEMKLASLQETVEAERQSTTLMEGRKQAMIQQEELIASLQETISDQVSHEPSTKLEVPLTIHVNFEPFHSKIQRACVL